MSFKNLFYYTYIEFSGAIRITGSSSTSYIPSHSGRVEVYLNNQWGTISDDLWDINDAHVACRMLGYANALYARTSAYYGQGTGPIWMDDVACTGSENSLFSCSYDRYTSEDSHSEDAGVTCSYCTW